MTELVSHRLRQEHQVLTVPVRGAGPADVIELVLADHRRIRRLSQSLDAAVRWAAHPGPGWVPAHIWQRLAEVLCAHTFAEEEICYLPASRRSARAAAHTRDRAAEHDDIREAIAEAALQPAGSVPWWRAVRAVQADVLLHFDQEERDILVGLRRQLTVRQRVELGRQWMAFIATWTLDSSQ